MVNVIKRVGRIKDAVKFIDAAHHQKNMGCVIKSKTDFCLVVYVPEKKKIVISFKGSDPDIKDWIGISGNLSYWDINQDGFHDGFWNGYKSVESKIVCETNKILKSKQMVKKIEVVGYSRGAGLAQICLLDLRDRFDMEFCGVGFGTPSVFSLYKAVEFNMSHINFIRVVNGYDFISTFDYRAFSLHCVGSCFSLKKPFWHKLPLLRVLDHRLPNYKKSIKKL